MEILGIIVLIIVFIAQNSKKQGTKKAPQQNYRSEGNDQYRSSSSAGEQPWEKAARENIEKAARRAASVANKALNDLFEDVGDGNIAPASNSTASTSSSYTTRAASTSMTDSSPKDKPEDELSASEQIKKRRLENRYTSILDRAKENAEEEKEDVTLNTMEAEHNHSERVSPAKHHHPEDVIPENMLGSVEDLMVKGYDGSLCFERDFVGEAMDMISRFTVPSDIPEYSNSEAS